MTIRSLTLADLDALTALHARCFGAAAWGRDSLRGSLSLPTTLALGVEQEGRLTAFLLIQVVGQENEILTLGTDPAHRRKGLARALIAAAHPRLSGHLFLEVAENNGAARALYESLGMTVYARRKGYYTGSGTHEDALNYRLKLIE